MASGFLADLRLGVRSLLRSPGYGSLSIGTLAIGVASVAAVLSVLHAVVLKPLPYGDPSELAYVWTVKSRQAIRAGSSYPNLVDWKAQNQSFDDLAFFFRPEFTEVILTDGPDGAARVDRSLVSSNFFAMLEVQPQLGRIFTQDDFDAGSRVVVLSHAFWRRWFDADSAVVGRTLIIDDVASEVIGVMPRRFAIPNEQAAFWEPYPLRASEGPRDADAWFVIGRLKDGVGVEAAQLDMEVIAQRLEGQYPESNAGLTIDVRPLLDEVTGAALPRALWLLSGAAVFVLLIACSNVANLQLTRWIQRTDEVSLRRALGASRGVLVRQVLAENVVMFGVAGAVGLGLGVAYVRAFVALAPPGMPRLADVRLDPIVLVLVLLVLCVVGLVFSSIPAGVTVRLDPMRILRRSRQGSTARFARRLGEGLLVSQISLAVVLLWGAGLLIRSIDAVQSEDRGFDTKSIVVVTTEMPMMTPSEQVEAFYPAAIGALQGLPGVAGVGGMGDFFIERLPDIRIETEGTGLTEPQGDLPKATNDAVLPGTFDVLGMRPTWGRTFTGSDMGSDRAVINETMARRFWPGRDPTGSRFRVIRSSSPGPWLTVLGVVSDLRREGLEVPRSRLPWRASAFTA